MQLGQQAAVGQSELVTVQEAAARLAQLWLPSQLVLQGRAQVSVQPGEGAQQQLVQGWGGAEGFGEDPVRDAAPPTVAAAADRLTIILLGHRVLDERGELVKDVVARGCGLSMAGRQAGESGVEEELMSDARAQAPQRPSWALLGAPPAVPRPSLGGS